MEGRPPSNAVHRGRLGTPSAAGQIPPTSAMFGIQAPNEPPRRRGHSAGLKSRQLPSGSATLALCPQALRSSATADATVHGACKPQPGRSPAVAALPNTAFLLLRLARNGAGGSSSLRAHVMCRQRNRFRYGRLSSIGDAPAHRACLVRVRTVRARALRYDASASAWVHGPPGPSPEPFHEPSAKTGIRSARAGKKRGGWTVQPPLPVQPPGSY